MSVSVLPGERWDVEDALPWLRRVAPSRSFPCLRQWEALTGVVEPRKPRLAIRAGATFP